MTSLVILPNIKKELIPALLKCFQKITEEEETLWIHFTSPVLPYQNHVKLLQKKKYTHTHNKSYEN